MHAFPDNTIYLALKKIISDRHVNSLKKRNATITTHISMTSLSFVTVLIIAAYYFFLLH